MMSIPVAALLLALGGAPEASSPAAWVVIESETCPHLDLVVLQDRLNLELAAVVDSATPRMRLRLVFACEEASVEIRVVDPRTGKRMARKIPAPDPDDPERERIVALSTSELFATAWLDLLEAPPPERVEAEPPPGEPPPAPPPEPEPAPPPRRDELFVEAGAVVRGLPGALPMGRVGLGYGGWLGRGFGVFGFAAFEGGRARRSRGAVEAIAIHLGPRVAWRSKVRRRTRFTVAAHAAALWSQLRGLPATGVARGIVRGFGADVGARLGPRFDLRRLSLSVDIGGGWLAAGPTGRVTDERLVQPRGGWVGATLTLAFPPTRRRLRG